jgi:hypothetical protein
LTNATLTLTASVPNPGHSNADYAARALMVSLLEQAAHAFGSGLATSGNLIWPPGNAPQVVGSWVYVAPS